VPPSQVSIPDGCYSPAGVAGALLGCCVEAAVLTAVATTLANVDFVRPVDVAPLLVGAGVPLPAAQDAASALELEAFPCPSRVRMRGLTAVGWG
jgi:hypothetical protein